MSTQRNSSRRGPGRAGAAITSEKEVVKEARRLVLESLGEEEHRWTEIGYEAEQALKRLPLSVQSKKAFERLLEERNRRFRAICAKRLELKAAAPRL
jgi:hypothetical protein